LTCSHLRTKSKIGPDIIKNDSGHFITWKHPNERFASRREGRIDVKG